MGGQEVQQFLSHLAVAGHVAASTQSQALSAILFLYQQVKVPIQRHLHDVHKLHTQDLQPGAVHVYLPYALERKYPHASHEWV